MPNGWEHDVYDIAQAYVPPPVTPDVAAMGARAPATREEQAFWLAYAQGQAARAQVAEAKKAEQDILARGIPKITGAIHTPMSRWAGMTPAEREGLTWYEYDRLAKEHRETEEKRTRQILGTESQLRDELAKLWYQYPSLRKETGMGAVSWAESEIWGALPDWARQITAKVGEVAGTEIGGIGALEQVAKQEIAAPASQWLPPATPTPTAPKAPTPTQKRWQYPPPARWLMY